MYISLFIILDGVFLFFFFHNEPPPLTFLKVRSSAEGATVAFYVSPSFFLFNAVSMRSMRLLHMSVKFTGSVLHSFFCCCRTYARTCAWCYIRCFRVADKCITPSAMHSVKSMFHNPDFF